MKVAELGLWQSNMALSNLASKNVSEEKTIELDKVIKRLYWYPKLPMCEVYLISAIFRLLSQIFMFVTVFSNGI